MLKFRKTVRAWYEGKNHPYENGPYSSVVVFGWWTERHWTSADAHVLVEFWLEHWKYVITTGLAVIGLVIALKKLG